MPPLDACPGCRVGSGLGISGIHDNDSDYNDNDNNNNGSGTTGQLGRLD